MTTFCTTITDLLGLDDDILIHKYDQWRDRVEGGGEKTRGPPPVAPMGGVNVGRECIYNINVYISKFRRSLYVRVYICRGPYLN